jgi:hypothetical protein
MRIRLLCLIFWVFILAGCRERGGTQAAGAAGAGDGSIAKGTFAYDLHFLYLHDNIIILRDSNSAVIVSPRYQAKVFTSTADGDGGPSFGWVNYKAFDGPPNPHMNAYGGEDRLWLGPEGGRFSLFFAPGEKMDFDHWKTPGAFDTAAWDVDQRTDTSVALHKDMKLTNYAGTPLNLTVKRRITILNRAAIDKELGIELDSSVRAVGYDTYNMITNGGPNAWTDATGMPCIWMLDMFPPSPSTVIMIPYNTGDTSKPATTDYFGEIPADRIRYDNGVLYFKADGKMRGKLGIHPTRALTVAGSYDSARHLLTIIKFEVEPVQHRYLNQEWRTDKPLFSGDAVNAYNDGPLADGSQMGPFYELESVSQAIPLRPGWGLGHEHAVFHFTGKSEQLEGICKKVLRTK